MIRAAESADAGMGDAHASIDDCAQIDEQDLQPGTEQAMINADDVVMAGSGWIERKKTSTRSEKRYFYWCFREKIITDCDCDECPDDCDGTITTTQRRSKYLSPVDDDDV